MPISFGRSSLLPLRAPTAVAPVESRLLDLRSPEAFGAGFIPGSYNVPDLVSVAAAQRTGLFRGRKLYMLADDAKQVQDFTESADLGDALEIAGWFDVGALKEWRKATTEMGGIEFLSAETLAIRFASWNILLFDIYEGETPHAPTHADALHFRIDEVPLSMDGLPESTNICLNARTPGLASFAASLLWNFGFHKVSCLNHQGCCIRQNASAEINVPAR